MGQTGSTTNPVIQKPEASPKPQPSPQPPKPGATDEEIKRRDEEIKRRDAEIGLLYDKLDNCNRTANDLHGALTVAYHDLNTSRRNERDLLKNLENCAGDVRTCRDDSNTQKSIIAKHGSIRNILYGVIAVLVVTVFGLGIWMLKLRKESGEISTMSGYYDSNGYVGDIYEDY